MTISKRNTLFLIRGWASSIPESMKEICVCIFVFFFSILSFPKANPSMRTVTVTVIQSPKTLRESPYLQPEDPRKGLLPLQKAWGKIQDISFFSCPCAPVMGSAQQFGETKTLRETQAFYLSQRMDKRSLEAEKNHRGGSWGESFDLCIPV